MKKSISVLIILSVILASILVFSATAYTENDDKAADLKKLNLFNGTDKGFELDKEPTRDQGAVLLTTMLGKRKYAEEMKFSHPFNDVPEWANAYVGYLYHEGFTSGIGNGKYGSSDKLSANSYITFILRSLGYSTENGDFKWDQAIDMGKSIGLITDSKADALKNSAPFLRDDVVGISYNALKTNIKDTCTPLINKLVDTDGVVDKKLAIGTGIYIISNPTNNNDDNNNPIENTQSNVVDNSKLTDAENAAKNIVTKFIKPGMNDFEKAFILFDYLRNNSLYEGNTVYSSMAYGTLIGNLGICGGFSDAMDLLLNFAGLDSYEVGGTLNGGGHFWNIVKLNGDYYYIDATSHTNNSQSFLYGPDDMKKSGYGLTGLSAFKMTGLPDHSKKSIDTPVVTKGMRNNWMQPFYVKGDYIYYLKYNSSYKLDYVLFKKNLITGMEEKAFDFILKAYGREPAGDNVVFDGDMAYVWDRSRGVNMIQRSNLDGSDMSLIKIFDYVNIPGRIQYIDSAYARDGWVYLVLYTCPNGTEKYQLMKMKGDGSESSIILKDLPSTPKVGYDNILWYTTDNKDGKAIRTYYKMGLDSNTPILFYQSTYDNK